MVANARMTPEEVAEVTLKAVKRNRLYVVPFESASLVASIICIRISCTTSPGWHVR